jgi:hypothetical protein
MYWIYVSEISSPSIMKGFFLTEPTPTSRHICQLHLSAIPPGVEGNAMLCLQTSYCHRVCGRPKNPGSIPKIRWLSSLQPLGWFWGSPSWCWEQIGWHATLITYTEYGSDKMRGVIPPLRHTSSGNCLKEVQGLKLFYDKNFAT